MDDDLDAGTDIANSIGITDDAVEPSTAPEQGDDLRGDIESAIAQQKIERGDPEPYKGLKGRTDNQPGGLFEGCDEFAKEAAKNGTTLKQAVTDYSRIESAVKADPVRGTIYALQRMGKNPVAVAQAILRQAQPQTQSQFAQNYQAQQYQAQQNYQAKQAYQEREQRHNADIEKLERTLPFFKEYETHMTDMVNRVNQSRPGAIRTAKQAYDLFMRANPSLGMSAEIARRDAVRDRQMGRGKRR